MLCRGTFTVPCTMKKRRKKLPIMVDFAFDLTFFDKRSRLQVISHPSDKIPGLSYERGNLFIGKFNVFPIIAPLP